MIRSQLALFIALRPTEQQWTNIDTSLVKRAVIPYNVAIADSSICQEFTRRGIKYIVRLLCEDYAAGKQWVCARNLADLRTLAPSLEGVIVGNEPDIGLESDEDRKLHMMEFGQDRNWHEGKAYQYRYQAEQMRVQLNLQRGWELAVPDRPRIGFMAMTARIKSEDGPPQAGLVSWAEIMRPVARQFDFTCVHLYVDGYEGICPDMQRIKYGLQIAAMLHHTALGCDEMGIPGQPGMTQVQRVAAYLDTARWLCSNEQNKEGRTGSRYHLLAPFIAVGDPGSPPAWDPRYIISDPRCYEQMAEFMQGR